MITRYSCGSPVDEYDKDVMQRHPCGDHVRYDDHAAAIAAKDAEIARLRGEVARWVACSERLPDIQQDVVGWGPKRGALPLQWWGTHWSHWPTNDFIPSTFTHWMPLPIPPITTTDNKDTP